MLNIRPFLQQPSPGDDRFRRWKGVKRRRRGEEGGGGVHWQGMSVALYASVSTQYM